MRKMIYTTLFIALAAIVGAQSGEVSNEGNSEECSMPPMLQNFMMPGSKFREMKSKVMREMGYTCLRLTPPKEMMNIMKTCMMNVLKSPEIMEDFKSDEKTVSDMIGAIRAKLRSCHYAEYGFDLSGNDLKLEDLLEKMELNEWVGTMKELTINKQILENCAATVEGDTSIERLQEFEKCTHFGLIDHCEEQEEDIGMLPAMMGLFLTSGDEPMCDNVEVPQEVFDHRMKCLKEAAEGVDVSEVVEAEKSPLMKAFVLCNELSEKVTIPFLECILEKNTVSMIDKDSKKFKPDLLIGFVKQMKGWDDIPQKRDEVLEAISKCSVVYDEEAPQEETKMELYNRLMKQFIEYDRCFLPKFARTCGMKNKLTEVLVPLFHKEFLKTSIDHFVKSGGRAAKEVMTFMKEKMG